MQKICSYSNHHWWDFGGPLFPRTMFGGGNEHVEPNKKERSRSNRLLWLSLACLCPMCFSVLGVMLACNCFLRTCKHTCVDAVNRYNIRMICYMPGKRCTEPAPIKIMQNLFMSSEKVQSIKVVGNDCIGPNHTDLNRHGFAKCFAALRCLPHSQAKGWFMSSEKVQSIKDVRNDGLRPNHGHLYRQWFARCVAVVMRSTWPSKRLAAENWKPRLQPPLRVSLCDGSPDLWDGQPLPPEDGGRCCRGVPRPGPRLAQRGVVCRTPTDRACRRCRTWPGKTQRMHWSKRSEHNFPPVFLSCNTHLLAVPFFRHKWKVRPCHATLSLPLKILRGCNRIAASHRQTLNKGLRGRRVHVAEGELFKIAWHIFSKMSYDRSTKVEVMTSQKPSACFQLFNLHVPAPRLGRRGHCEPGGMCCQEAPSRPPAWPGCSQWLTWAGRHNSACGRGARRGGRVPQHERTLNPKP